MALNSLRKRIANSAAHDLAVEIYLHRRGPWSRRQRAQGDGPLLDARVSELIEERAALTKASAA